MIFVTVLSLWFSSVLPPVIAETPQVHIKEAHKDHTVISSRRDEVYGDNCVKLAHLYRPDIPFINASDMPVATSTPRVNSVGKIRYNSGAWHVFLVLEVREDTLKVIDANYDEGYVTIREVPVDDVRIVGYL